MADQASDPGDAVASDAPAERSAVPAVGVRAQYVKDLSFENPHAPAGLAAGQQPRIDVNVNVEARPLDEPAFEVALLIRADARVDKRVAFLFELEYAGLFDLSRVPAEHRHAVCLIEAPRLLFPFARQIAAEATRNGGYPPMYLDPIDFAALYHSHMQSLAAGDADRRRGRPRRRQRRGRRRGARRRRRRLGLALARMSH